MTTSDQSSSPSSVEADTGGQSNRFEGRVLGILVVLLVGGIFARVAGSSMPSILIAGVFLGWVFAVYRIGVQWRVSGANTDIETDTHTHTPLPDDPAERARARYARGELSYEEFENRLVAVSSGDDPSVPEGKGEVEGESGDECKGEEESKTDDF